MANVSFVNLTPHAIVIRLVDGTDLTFPPSGKVARVDEAPNFVNGEIGGIPIISRTVFGEVIDLPEPVEGIGYIVSGLVAGVVYRADVFAPATGPKDGAIRNDKGQIVAVVALKATTNGIDSGVVIC
jgi:hypothetical protein